MVPTYLLCKNIKEARISKKKKERNGGNVIVSMGRMPMYFRDEKTHIHFTCPVNKSFTFPSLE